MTRRIAVLSVVSGAGEVGGAERMFHGLAGALSRDGLAAEIVPMRSDEANFIGIQRSYLAAWDTDLSGFDGVVSTKAPTYAARHPNHVCYLMHTMRVFYDMFAQERPSPSAADRAQQQQIHALDRLLLSPRRIRRLFTIGEEVRLRLLSSLGRDASVLRHASTLPPAPDAPRQAGERPYLLLPGRLHRWKRVDLAIAAMRATRADVDLLITGEGEDGPALRRAAAPDPRVKFLGAVEEAALARLYAGARAVLFLPLREDLGLATLEAYAAGRPVVTCTDSGEPARLVRDGETGLVVPPQAYALAAAVERLSADPGLADRLGAAGRRAGAEISWARVGAALADALAPGYASRAA